MFSKQRATKVIVNNFLALEVFNKFDVANAGVMLCATTTITEKKLSKTTFIYQPKTPANLKVIDNHELKCHCNGKIVDLILIATEQYFRTRLNSAFSFLISCLVSEIFGFLKHAN